jgi:F420-dependent oxidoreductase-like protein
MKFSFWFRPDQPWHDVLTLAHHLEATGWDGVWFADHFMSMGDDGHDILECWSVLAGLAANVPRVRIGSLVSGNTYRHPAVLANAATTVDQMSGGRLVVGLGSGWQRNEHEAYGIEFFDVGGRLARLDEACQVLRQLFSQERSTFDGEFYRLADAPLEPKGPAAIPILVGGGGEQVTLKIVARHADEWNTWGLPEHLAHKGAVLDSHCEKVGRDPRSIRRSAQALLFVSSDRGWVDARRDLAASRQPTIVGTPAEVVEVFHSYRAAGVDEIIIPQFTLGDHREAAETADLLMSEVIPALR